MNKFKMQRQKHFLELRVLQKIASHSLDQKLALKMEMIRKGSYLFTNSPEKINVLGT